jgi:predicted dehydrogenase
MTTFLRPTRREALATMLATGVAPMVFRRHATAAPSETVLHASFGAGGMAASDIGSFSGNKHFKLVAVADVDQGNAERLKVKFPDIRLYSDWRQLLEKEKDLNSVNISTPDHMHAPITMSAIKRGLHVYTQKPLTQSIYEARMLTKAAADKKIISQMGIQIHSHVVHRTVVEIVQGGAIGKVKEVHSWSGKEWGDNGKLPVNKDAVPGKLNWDFWLGIAAERPYIGGGYYHPGNWRKRLDFGTGTFGDMGCHILDPVYGAVGFTLPLSVECQSGGANETNWGLHNQVKYVFPETKVSEKTVSLTWYDGNRRPPADVTDLIKPHKMSDQGSIYIGSKGVLYSPYIAAPILLPAEQFKEYKMPTPGGRDHYGQFIEAVRGNGETSAPFSYSGPLTEMVLLGCLATRFPGKALEWDAANLKVKNVPDANKFVKREYRKGWEVEGL